MRNWLLAGVAAATLLAGCSQQDGASREASDVNEEPNVSPSAAPGVAWRYSYNYQLRDETISSVQEAHASACEALGTARCRITGLNYSVGEDETVSAMLEVKLAPDLARQFGKAATARVDKEGGKLLSTQFTGEDVTPASSDAARRQQDLSSQIADLESQLARATSASERNALNARLGELRAQLAYARGTLAEANEKLASTDDVQLLRPRRNRRLQDQSGRGRLALLRIEPRHDGDGCLAGVRGPAAMGASARAIGSAGADSGRSRGARFLRAAQSG